MIVPDNAVAPSVAEAEYRLHRAAPATEEYPSNIFSLPLVTYQPRKSLPTSEGTSTIVSSDMKV